MSFPRLEVITLKPAVRSDAAVTLDVLIRITPPTPTFDASESRPPLNLGVVLDRSGSMADQNKMASACAAATFAIQQVLPTDRVSVTIFDDKVETLIDSTFAEDKMQLIESIRAIHPRGSTDLHGGWKAGGSQVSQHLIANGLNRVLLLSDGLANVGETNLDTIATHVNHLAKEGVSTTTMGVGDDYNEVLMEAMARSGDGNYYYIENPEQLANIFEIELKGLMAIFGHTVSLGMEPQNNVTVVDILNDLDRLPSGEVKLPNLIAGMPIVVVVRLQVPAMPSPSGLCSFRLVWNAPNVEDRQSLRFALELPVTDGLSWETIAPNVDVQERVAVFLIARAKKEAIACLDRRDRNGATECLKNAKLILAAAPNTPLMQREAAALARIEELLANQSDAKFRKHASNQSHQTSRSLPYTELG